MCSRTPPALEDSGPYALQIFASGTASQSSALSIPPSEGYVVGNGLRRGEDSERHTWLEFTEKALDRTLRLDGASTLTAVEISAGVQAVRVRSDIIEKTLERGLRMDGTSTGTCWW